METSEKRLVVKVGTSTITNENGEPDLRTIDKLAQVLSAVHNLGYDVILVSSGAIAVGVNKMRLSQRPKELRMKQATAAVGQCELMHLYDKCFGEYGNTVAQILLTSDDIADTEKRTNLKNTFSALLENRIIPVVNENDSVSFTEIESPKKVFGDNDGLSSLVALLCGASKLIIMSDIEGLYDKNPADHADANLIHQVDDVTDDIIALADGSGSNRGRGGMITKLEAAKTATSNGRDMHIIMGKHPENLYDVLDGKERGTWFKAK